MNSGSVSSHRTPTFWSQRESSSISLGIVGDGDSHHVSGFSVSDMSRSHEYQLQKNRETRCLSPSPRFPPRKCESSGCWLSTVLNSRKRLLRRHTYSCSPHIVLSSVRRGRRGRGKKVSGTCEEMCFEKRRVEMAVAQGVRVLGC
jgi:hypothetical protein